jgi:hypothetical protein
MELSKLPHYPYPKDGPTRFGFIIGDSIAWSVIFMIAFVTLKSTLRF